MSSGSENVFEGFDSQRNFEKKSIPNSVVNWWSSTLMDSDFYSRFGSCRDERIVHKTSALEGFNSLALGRSECDSKNVIFILVLLIGIFRSSHEDALWWMPHDLTDDKSTLVQAMSWAVRQQAITWTSVDSVLCRLMASLGNNELTRCRAMPQRQCWMTSSGAN